jgi:hypothetical protein
MNDLPHPVVINDLQTDRRRVTVLTGLFSRSFIDKQRISTRGSLLRFVLKNKVSD